MSSHLFGRFNHGAAHMGKWSDRDYSALQSKIVYHLKNRLSFDMLKLEQKRKNYFVLNEEESSDWDAIEHCVAKYNQKMEEKEPIRYVPLPQWFLLERACLLTIEHNHMLLKLKKLAKLANCCRPKSEHRELVLYMTNTNGNRRDKADYEYFRPI